MEIHEYQRNISARNADIKTLMGDPRFNAVLALIRSLREEQVVWAASPTISNESGKAAHSLGGVYALSQIEHHLLAAAVVDENLDE